MADRKLILGRCVEMKKPTSYSIYAIHNHMTERVGQRNVSVVVLHYVIYNLTASMTEVCEVGF